MSNAPIGMAVLKSATWLVIKYKCVSAFCLGLRSNSHTSCLSNSFLISLCFAALRKHVRSPNWETRFLEVLTYIFWSLQISCFLEEYICTELCLRRIHEYILKETYFPNTITRSDRNSSQFHNLFSITVCRQHK